VPSSWQMKESEYQGRANTRLDPTKTRFGVMGSCHGCPGGSSRVNRRPLGGRNQRSENLT